MAVRRMRLFRMGHFAARDREPRHTLVPDGAADPAADGAFGSEFAEPILPSMRGHNAARGKAGPSNRLPRAGSLVAVGEYSARAFAAILKSGRLFAPVWIVAFLLLALWAYKARDLALPYFWDELGVYGRAAVYMNDHQLSLLPRALPTELSRGHPLLLAFLCGAVFRLFGATPTAGHVFMLMISSGLILSVFWIASAHWKAWVGLVASVALLAQPVFLAQSTLVLPEIPMALACLWAVHAFSQRRYGLVGLSIGLAIFFKETAVILDLVLAAILCGQCWRARRVGASGLRALLAISIPVACYGVFLVIQKQQNGWYLYPLHSGQIDFRWPAMKEKLSEGLGFLFAEQGRVAMSVVVVLWLLLRLLGRPEGKARLGPTIVVSFSVFIGAFLIFSAGNVFMKRYLLCLLPPFTIMFGAAVFDLAREQLRVALPATAGLCLFCLAELQSPRFNCAYDMGFREAVLLQQEATRYLEDNVGCEMPILANFPTVVGLEDPRFGYASRRFSRSSYVPSVDDQYIFACELYERFEPPAGVRTELVKRFMSPYMNIALYRVLH